MATTKTPARGTFDCTVCGPQAPFRKHTISGGLKLGGIALLRWGQVDEYVECQRCESTYLVDVLLPEAQSWHHEPLHLDAAMRVMLLMMLADGEIAQKEVDTIRWTWKAIAGQEMRDSMVLTQAEHAKADPRGIHEYVAAVRPMLNDKGKREVLRCARVVAAADGVYREEEQAFMRELVGLLGMKPDVLDTLDVPAPPTPPTGAPPPPPSVKTVTPASAPPRSAR